MHKTTAKAAASRTLSAISLLCLSLNSQAAAPDSTHTDVTTQETGGAQQTGTASTRVSAVEEVEAIVVTGSRIKRAGFDTLQPAVAVDRQQIENQAVTNIGELLNSQAGFGIPSASPTGVQARATLGQSHINFLGLGSSRTLTLVNGKRFVSSNSPSNQSSPGLQVDLNTIPIGLIDRVETIAVGGAPIYGTDAIAGTVNIILRTRFNGFSVAGKFGGSPQYEDALQNRFGLIAGSDFSGGRGNVTAAIEHTRSDGLLYFDRPRTTGRGYAFQVPAGASPYSLTLIENARIVAVTQNGLPLARSVPFGFATQGNGIHLDPDDPASPIAQFDGDGNLVPYDPGARTGNTVFASGGDGTDITRFRSLANDATRTNANIFTSYDLSPSVRFTSEAWFARTVHADKANEGQYQSTIFGSGNSFNTYRTGPIPVLLSNPYIPPATLSILTRALDLDGDGAPDANIDTNGDAVVDAPGFFIERNLATALGHTDNKATQELYRLVGSLEGELMLGGSAFDWDASAVYGRSQDTSSGRRVVRDRFTRAVNAVRNPVTGQIECFDRSNGCVPINALAGIFDPAAAALVTAEDEAVSVNTQMLVGANISGPAVDLPAGPVKFVAGVEYRKEDASYTPSEPDRLRLFDTASLPISGTFNTKEIYGEIAVPLVRHDMGIPLVSRLEFEGAARLADNSIAGSAVTWTAGGKYEPVMGLAFRGNLTNSVRAPSITELFLPEVPTFVLARDPCDSRFVNQGAVPGLRASNCQAAGITGPFVSRISDASQPAVSSGNPNLDTEEAESWSAGVVIKPERLKGFALAADWIDIKLKNGIESLNGEAVLQSCYDSPAYPDEPSCRNFTRAPGGQIDSLRIGYVNVGSVHFAGLSLTGNYLWDLEQLGHLEFRLDYLYTDRLTRTIGAARPVEQAGGIGFSKDRINVGITWSKGAFALFNHVRWIGSAVFDTSDTSSTRDVKGVPSWWTVNSGVNWRMGEHFSAQLNVENVFDESVPYPAPIVFGTGAGNTVSTYYDGILGRYMSLTFRAFF